jgi:branched-chain amino acid transport system permease protein
MVQQILMDGLVAGCAYALVALGFGLIFKICRFYNLAHGAVYTLGAYLAYLFVNLWGWRLGFGVGAAVLGTAVIGYGIEAGVYRPMRRKHTTSLVLLMASLGLLVSLQNLVALLFGDDTKLLRAGVVQEGISLLGARVTPIQLLTVLTSVLLSAGLWIWLRQSKWGKMIQAVGNDPALSLIVGVPNNKAIAVTFVVGSALAGVAAILLAFDTDLTPTMGLRAILMGIVAIIVGGVGSIPGSFLGGLLIGMAEHLGVWKLPTQWQDTIVFAVLIVFLIARPQGLLGTPVGRAEV